MGEEEGGLEVTEGGFEMTFSRSVAAEVLDLTGVKTCQYCGKKLTPKNFGGVVNAKGLCSNILCLIQLAKQMDGKQ